MVNIKTIIKFSIMSSLMTEKNENLFILFSYQTKGSATLLLEK